jgi:hypothetical protein
MRLAIPLALLLVAAAAPRHGCGNGGTPAYDACAGKACGDSCTACPPGSTDCMETAVVKACDPSGRCLPRSEGMCGAADGACTGKKCGDECVIDPPCRTATPPCMTPSVHGYCYNDSSCVAGPPPPCPQVPPSWGCVGKACGDGCGYCPPGTDPANCPVPTLVATVCDARLQCASAVTVTCSPQAACLGKPCGAACETCPTCMDPVAEYCDPSGACVKGTVTCPP